MRTYTPEERETTIIWNAKDKTAKIWTADPFVMRKLDKKVSEHPEQYKCVLDDQKWGAKRYEVPKKLVRFGNPPSQARIEVGRRVAKMRAESLQKGNMTDE